MNDDHLWLKDALDRQGQQVKQLAELIGQEKESVFSWEHLSTLEYDSPNFPAEQAAGLDFPALQTTLKDFDVEVTCYFALQEHDLAKATEDPEVLDLAKDGGNPVAIERFQERILACRDLIFVFALDKDDLLSHYGLNDGRCRFFLFLFKEALIDYFGLPQGRSTARATPGFLRDLEDDLWPEGSTEKVMILTPSVSVHLNGPYLSLVGGDLLAGWPGLVPDEEPDFERLSTLYGQCRKLVKWDQEWIERLTPYHLEFEPKTEQSEDTDEWTAKVTSLLRQHLANLCILYTANRTVRKRAEWVSVYWDSLNRVEVPSSPTAEALLPARSLAQVEQLLAAVRWVYDSKWPRDRLYFMQSSMAQELRRTPMVSPAQAMLDEIETIYGTMDRRLDQFVREQEKAFSAEERALQDFAAATAETFSGQVSQMIKAVSDTMLAAIAALLGSFIAAGFGQNTFEAHIFTIGMVVYSLYVLIFPLLYNMSNQWVQYKALEDSVKASYKRFADKLGDERAQELAGDLIQRSKRRFRRWFFITVGVYLFAIIAGLVAAFWVPQLVN